MRKVRRSKSGRDALEALVVANTGLEQLEAPLDQFNIFEAAGEEGVRVARGQQRGKRFFIGSLYKRLLWLDQEERLRAFFFAQTRLRIPAGAGGCRLPLSYPHYLQVAFCVLGGGEGLAQPSPSPHG